MLPGGVRVDYDRAGRADQAGRLGGEAKILMSVIDADQGPQARREAHLPAPPPARWKDDPMRITRQIVVFDAADLTAESTLWARLLEPAGDMESASGHQVCADPAGHPFCLCRG